MNIFQRSLPVFVLAAVPLAAHALTPSQVYDKVKDSVVIIKTLNKQDEAVALGSGVVLPSGKIATNCHVVKGGASFQVGRSESLVPAMFHAGDENKDLCLLLAFKRVGTPAQIGKAVTLKVGDTVYAVGAPKGLELSLSNGIVSQLRSGPPPLIQTTAAISHGSSGGGLFDSEGRLVGLTTLYIDDGQSLNFAMPVEWLEGIQPGKGMESKQRSKVDWITRAAALEEKWDWQRLLAWGSQWVKAEHNDAGAWFAIGRSHQNLGQLEQAITAYRQTIRINPEYHSAWHNLGMVYAKLERYDDAVVALRQSIRGDPSNPKTWFILGVVYKDQNRSDDAVSAFRQTLRMDPRHDDAWHFLGLIYDNSKRYTEAIAAYRQALAINPEHTGALTGLGATYTTLERYPDAIAAYRLALRINSEDIMAWGGLALAYHFSGDTTAALQAVKSLRPLNPAFAEKIFGMIVPR